MFYWNLDSTFETSITLTSQQGKVWKNVKHVQIFIHLSVLITARHIFWLMNVTDDRGSKIELDTAENTTCWKHTMPRCYLKYTNNEDTPKCASKPTGRQEHKQPTPLRGWTQTWLHFRLRKSYGPNHDIFTRQVCLLGGDHCLQDLGCVYVNSEQRNINFNVAQLTFTWPPELHLTFTWLSYDLPLTLTFLT